MDFDDILAGKHFVVTLLLVGILNVCTTEVSKLKQPVFLLVMVAFVFHSTKNNCAFFGIDWCVNEPVHPISLLAHLQVLFMDMVLAVYITVITKGYSATVFAYYLLHACVLILSILNWQTIIEFIVLFSHPLWWISFASWVVFTFYLLQLMSEHTHTGDSVVFMGAVGINGIWFGFLLALATF